MASIVIHNGRFPTSIFEWINEGCMIYLPKLGMFLPKIVGYMVVWYACMCGHVAFS